MNLLFKWRSLEWERERERESIWKFKCCQWKPNFLRLSRSFSRSYVYFSIQFLLYVFRKKSRYVYVYDILFVEFLLNKLEIVFVKKKKTLFLILFKKMARFIRLKSQVPDLIEQIYEQTRWENKIKYTKKERLLKIKYLFFFFKKLKELRMKIERSSIVQLLNCKHGIEVYERELTLSTCRCFLYFLPFCFILIKDIYTWLY